ncbi:HalOD1 output domain-containing protein [Haladaptatus salinisoli]|uniref:HalOD1 output domain-containing protein n=1 Tax=Haladaptatus salinisoli TaxID=2884876 RepID=UPI0034A4B217
MAAAKGVDPAEVKDPVLYECVDVDALEDSFFGPRVSGQIRDGVGSVAFRYDTDRIEIASDGWISVSAVAFE